MRLSENSEKIQKLKSKAEKYVRGQKWKKVLQLYEEIAELDPKNDRVMRRIGDAHLKLGNKGAASQNYRRLAELYVKNGFWAKAISTNKLILEINPQDTQVQDELVKLYANMGIQQKGRSEAGGDDEDGIELDSSSNSQGSVDPSHYGLCIDLSEQGQGSTIDLANEEQRQEYVSEQPVFASAEESQTEAAPKKATSTATKEQDDFLIDLDEEFEDEVIELDDVVVATENVKAPLFSDFGPEEFTKLLHKLNSRRVPRGTVICQQGSPGNSLFVISSGSAEVSVEAEGKAPVRIAHLKSGDFFGEFGLLSNGVRHASVTAKSNVELLELTRKDLRELAQEHPRVLHVLDEYYRSRIIDTILGQNRLFCELTREERYRFVSKFKHLKVPANSYLFHEGDVSGDLYLIKSGKFEVSLQRDGDVIVVAELEAGDFFGEIALITGKPRTATIRSVVDGEVLVVSKADAKEILETSNSIKGKLQKVVVDRAEDAVAAYKSHSEVKQTLGLV